MSNAKGKRKKTRSGRPKRDPDKVFRMRLNLWFIRGEDDDLIGLFENVPIAERSQIAKIAWRKGSANMQSTEEEDAEELLDALFDEL